MFYYYRAKRRYTKCFLRLVIIFVGSFLIGYVGSTIGIWLNSFVSTSSNSDHRVFCVALSGNDRHLTSSKAILYSWGKRCDRFYFVTRLQNTSVNLMMLEKFENTSDVTSMNINRYTLEVLKYLHEEPLFVSYQWFLRTGDDSFVLVPNLRQLIDQFQRIKQDEKPIAYVGDVSRMYEEFFISTSGSVMIFNRAAINLLSQSQMDENGEIREPCRNDIVYDHEFVTCLKDIGLHVNPIDDNLILSQNLATYRKDRRLQNYCCSPKTVAFRASNETDMYKFEFLYHQLDPYSPIETL